MGTVMSVFAPPPAIMSEQVAERLRTRASGPEVCLQGELAHHADARLADLILPELMLAALDQADISSGLRVLRLAYWTGFHEDSSFWLSPCERELFQSAMDTCREDRPPVSDAALRAAWERGSEDGVVCVVPVEA